MNDEDPKIYNLGILEEKTYAFALRIIKAYNFLTSKNEYVLTKQLLRAGTSIGANCREATYAQSKMDFINKLSIALKEANETGYWLELLFKTNYIAENQYKELNSACISLRAMLISSINTAKENME